MMLKLMLGPAVLISACLTACHLPHMEPASREPRTAELATVRLFTSCSEVDMMSPEYNSDIPGASAGAPDIEWSPSKRGAGVMVSDNMVITAAHLVRCPVIPSAKARTWNGDEFPMLVERDDAMFGSGLDIARLQLIGALDRFDSHLSPPKLASSPWEGQTWCASTYRGDICGDVTWVGPSAGYFDGVTKPGDSGSGVYNLDGDLVGLVTGGNNKVTRVVRVNKYWLEGT